MFCFYLFFSVFLCFQEGKMEKLKKEKILMEKYFLNNCFFPMSDFFVSPNKGHIPNQGVKFHIVADNVEDYFNLIRRIVPLLDKYNITYKVVRPSRAEYFIDHQGTQRGKMITIYPTDNCNADFFFDKEVMAILNENCRNSVPNEKAFGGRLFGRFGGFTRLYVKDPLDGRIYEDDRRNPIPAFIPNIILSDFIAQCEMGKKGKNMDRYVPAYYRAI